MLEHLPQAVLRLIRIQVAPSDSQGDAALLDQFIRRQSDSAFTALLERHGTMVLSVCRRVLRDEHLAEDAFQATFLVLARKAGSIRNRSALASWLYGVALRLAHKLRAQTQRAERFISSEAVPPVATPVSTRCEEHEILDEELQRLPDRYRLPLVLCYLEGQTHNEAALQLGWSTGQLRGLLDRGRERLRARLVRRGVTLSAAGAATLLADTAVSAAVSPLLAVSTVKAAALFASGKTLAESGVATTAAGLVEGGLHMIGSKKAGVFVLLLLLASIGTGAALLAFGEGKPPADQPTPPPEPRKDAVAVQPQQPRIVPDPLEAPLPEGAVRLGTTRFRTGGMVSRLYLSHDGKRLVTSATGAGVFVFDSATGKRILHCSTLAGCGEISRDGERLFFIETVQTGPKTWEPVLRVYRLADGKLLETIERRKKVANFTLAPDGRTMAVEFAEVKQLDFPKYVYKSHLELLDLTTYRVLHKFGELDCYGPLNWLRFSPDSKSLFAVSTLAERNDKKSTVRRFDVATAALKSQFTIDGIHYSEPPVWNDKSLLAVGNKIWDVEKQRLHWSSKRGLGQIQAFMPCSESVLGILPENKIPEGDSSATLMQWDLETDRAIKRWPNRGGWPFILAKDAESCFMGDLHRVYRLDLATNKEINTVEAPTRPAWQFAFSPDRQYLATVDFLGMQVWDRRTGKLVHHQPVAFYSAGVLRFTPDGKTLLFPGTTTIATLEVGTWKQTDRAFEGLQFVRDGMTYCELSPDGKVLAVSSTAWGRPQVIKLWDWASGKVLGQLEHAYKGEQVQRLGPLAFSPDSKRLACLAYPQNHIQVWSVADRKRVADWETKRDLVSLQFIEHGGFLAGGFVPIPHPDEQPTVRSCDPRQGAVRVWASSNGQEKFHFQYDQAEYIGLAPRFLPDGKLAATADRQDKLIHFRALATGKEVGQFPAGPGGVENMAFSPDGKYLAVSGADTTVLIVDVRKVVK